MPADRIAVIAKLLTDLAASGATPLVPERSNAFGLHGTLVEHYPGLTVEEVRQAIAIAADAVPPRG